MKIIAGPCQHESLEHSTMIAKHCKSVCDDLGIDYYFKASFDKANRTSANGKRDRGMQRTMDDFVQIKENLDVKILTDFHSVFEIHAWRGVDEWYNAIDVIQIPAFLCRQTDLITTACNSGKIVNIKKGQFLAPWDVEGILSKTKSANEVWITERGTSFGYNTLVVDFTGILYMLEHYNNPIVFDVTHSVQKPGGKGSSSGGNRNFVAPLSRLSLIHI